MSRHFILRPGLAAIISVAGLVTASDADALRFDRTVTFRVFDAQSTMPVPEVFVAVDESVQTHVYAPGHGSTISTCIRSGAAHGRDGMAVVKMKSSGSFSLGGDSSLRSAVYAPGYCTPQRKALQGNVYAISATRSTDPPEHRLLALSDVARWFQNAGSCGEERAPEAEAALAAVVAEAKSIATTPYERHLAALLEHGIKGSPGPAPWLVDCNN